MVLLITDLIKLYHSLMKIKWSVLIIFASLIYNKYRLFFSLPLPRQSTINKCLRLMIHGSIIPSNDPYFQFDSNHIDYMPSIDKNEPFIMETTLT